MTQLSLNHRHAAQQLLHQAALSRMLLKAQILTAKELGFEHSSAELPDNNFDKRQLNEKCVQISCFIIGERGTLTDLQSLLQLFARVKIR